MKQIFLLPAKILVICFLMCHAMGVRAQSPVIQSDTIQWNASGFTDLNTTVNVDVSCQFVSYQNNRIDWIQSGGSYVNSFTVSAVTGSWEDLSANGTITFSLSASPLSGTIVFSKTDAGITADLTVLGGTDTIRNSYTISTFEKL